MRGRRQLNQQLVAILAVIGILLIGAALILGDDLPLVGTAGETEEPPPPPPDSDGDGIADDADACPSDPNHDSVGDPCNHDEDSDGVDDFSDACPSQGDGGFGVDGSGCPNPPPDSDGDGILDPNDSCPAQGDEGNGVDASGCPNPPPPTDSDGDGVNDDVDTCPDQGDAGNGVDASGCPNPPPPTDSDGDGVNDDVDTCPDQGDAGNGVDASGCPNDPVEVAPTDSDGDGVNDDVDTCPDQGDAGNGVDASGCPNDPVDVAPTDSDGDGVNDDVDTCPDQGDAGNGVDASGCPNDPVEVATVTLTVGFDASITTDTVQFTDTSTVEEGDTINGWSWDFGDGSTSGDQNPSHTYASTGTYTVTLGVTTTNGQTGSVQGSVTIEEAVEVVCNFESVALNDELPFQVQFNNLSSNVASYSWDFGNGQSSSDAGPHTITYDTAGTYAVVLTCTDSEGGTLTASGSVTAEEGTETVVELSAAFIVDNNSGAAPLTVTFTDNSASSEDDPIVSYVWSFGETGQGPFSVTYDTAGTYDVTLTVTTESGETATASGTITVEDVAEEPLPSISASPLVGEAPLTVTFSASSTGGSVDTWTWNTGDTGPGPHTITYDTPGSYTLRVDVEGSGGTGFAEQEIRVTESGAKVEAIFSFSLQAETAEGFPVCFTSTSTGEIATYNWNFGDGSGTSTEESPCYTYAAQGQYIVELSVVGVNSDEQSSAQQVVSIVPGLEAPVADFTANRTTVEVGQQVFLNNQSTGIISSYEWSFGDGGTSTAENPSHTYDVAGDYIISLRVTGPGGTSEAADLAISVVEAEITCSISGPGNVGFNLTGDYGVNVDGIDGQEITYRWTLDGAEVSTTDSFSQLFTTPGSYSLALEVIIEGEVACSASRTITVSEDNFSCDYAGDRSPRLNQTVTYRERNVNGRNDREITSQIWTIDGSEVGSGNSLRYQWTTAGTYSLTYTITLEDGTNCSRTRTVTVSSEAVECWISGSSRVDLYESRNYRANIGGLVSGQSVTGYSWSNGGTERNSTYRFGTIGESSVTIEVTIFYGEGESCVGTRTVTVRNGGQDRLSCNFNGDTNPLLTETIGYGGSVNNLEDRTATYSWTVDGVEVGTDRDLSYKWTTSGQFNLTFTVTPSEGEPCSRSRTVTVSDETLICRINGNGNPIEDVSYRYTSSIEGLSGRTANYVWTVDGVEVGTSQNVNYTFEASGTATISLSVTTDEEGVSCSATRTLNVQTGQSISAVATPNAGIAPLFVNFTADTNNMDRSTLTWHYPGGSTQRSETGSFLFSTPGQYTVTVTGEGPLGQQEASVVVNVGGNNVIRAAFQPNPYSGLAPLQVCFTDQSQGDEINSWSWDFGNGQTSTDQNPCTTYDTPGSWNVRLQITNVYGLEAFATNIVQTYEVGSNSGSIGIQVNGLQVCFSSEFTEGVTWDFGDGTTSTDPNPCHTYTENGTYTVALNVEGSSSPLVRQVSVQAELLGCQRNNPERLDCSSLAVTGVCQEGIAVFTIRNTGEAGNGDMRAPTEWRVYQDDVLVDSGQILLTGGATMEVTYDGSGDIRLEADQQIGHPGRSRPRETVNCGGSEEPELNVSGVCNEDGTLTFTFTNSGGDMDEGSAYTITAGNETLASGTTNALANGGSQSFTVNATDDGQTVTFSANGLAEDVSVENCYTPPSLSASGVCNGDGTATFTLTNNGGAMDEGTSYVIIGGGATLDSGTSNALANGGSQSFTVDATPDGKTITFSADGLVAYVSVESCSTPPSLSASGVCNEDGTVTFTLTNNGGAMDEGSVYAITAGGETLDSGTSNALDNGSSQSFTVSATPDGQTVTFSANGLAEDVSVESCSTPPSLFASGVCNEDGTVTFTLTNNGGDMSEGSAYTITAGGETLASGTSNALANGGSQSFTVNATDDGQTVTFSANGLAEDVSVENCYTPPSLAVTGICNEDGTVTFTLTNSGGKMDEGMSYSITVGNETLDSGTSNVLSNSGSQSFTVSATPDGQTITFSGDDLAEDVSVESCSTPPGLTANGVCNANGTVTFTLNNSGGIMDEGAAYTITAGNETVDSGTTNALANGESQTFTVDATNDGQTITFSADGLAEDVSVESCYTPPSLSASGICNEDGTVTFTLTNNGGLMPEGAAYTIKAGNETVDSGTTNALANGESQTFTVDATDDGQTITFSADGLAEDASVESCYTPPSLSASGICNEDGTVTFTLTNDGGLMPEGTAYTITAGNETLDSGTSNALANSESQSFTVDATDDGQTITFSADGLAEDASVENCYTPPSLSASGICNEDGTVTFTLTNNGGLMPEGTSYVIVANGETLDSGTSNTLANGESQTFTVDATDDGQTITFSAEDLAEDASVENCYTPPSLSASGVCNEDGTVTFTLTNEGGLMPEGTAYTITAGNETLDSGTSNALANGESQTFTVDATNDGQTITFSAEDLEESASVEECYAPPSLSASGVCNQNGTVTFTLTNEGGPMDEGFGYTIVAGDETLDSGITDVLTNGGSQTFTVDATNDGQTITFGIDEIEVYASVEECFAPPDLIPSGVCDESTGQTTFTVENLGGPMMEETTWQILDGEGNVVASDTFQLDADETFSYTVTDVVGTLNFQVQRYELFVTTVCFEDASLAIAGYCNFDGSATFTITNNGGDMALIGESLSYSVVNIDNVLIVENDAVVLGESETLPVTVQNVTDAVTLNLNFGAQSVTASLADCVIPPPPPPETPPGDEICGAVSLTGLFNFPVIDMDPSNCNDTPVTPEPWSPVEIGEGVCVDWLIYHTNQTGDWEIFRLGGDDLFPNTSNNLSEGVGERIFDLAPSRAPDGQWITFASNRDGNFEVYIASVGNIGPDGGRIFQRMTWNNRAVDIDPVWSPGGSFDGGNLIVYESSRNGKWDLYIFNVLTGEEQQLTDDPGNDINAFWSPAGDKLLFQSDRDGFWQIYELDLTNFADDGLPTETLLSDGSGDDHDPAYSNEGDRIVFRSFRDGDNSVIYVMDVDGTNVTQISDPNGYASNHIWSPNDEVIGYQSNLDGDNDIYVYQFPTGDEEEGQTRLITDNDIDDYAPTWYCESTQIVFSSNVDNTEETPNNPNLFTTNALPIDAEPIIVDEEASRLTTEPDVDYYPQNSPAEENASREGSLPSSEKNR